ncbi:hypothetical protein [Niabella drilacis]|uniref:Fasciclin domain-containing protein n=1 Tax=Niabella drilacis (strain DSM 25811 / CCM 8410 / CCUG 62505 / LMG 26954 / E90) TaxID=1285928 RepID=A0A1G6R9V4_NIADE|nr:hypothetical protein [Niabella drilacis]SDD01213.1 hypothetical protein SAMN04487894_105200 [Niabella drilacis]
MKKNPLIVCLFALLFLAACNKKDYFRNTGLQSGVFKENIYEFLQQRPFLFDSLVQVIDRSGMKEILQKETVTFFAPPDQSLMFTMNAINGSRYAQGKDSLRIADIPGDIWRRYLSHYIFKGRYMMNDISRVDFARAALYPGQNIESYDGFIMNMGVVYGAYSGTQDVGPRTIWLSAVGSNFADLARALTEQVATSNLQPQNGVVHALAGTAFFAYGSDFIAVVNDNVP